MDLETQDIKYVPGVGPKRAELLNKAFGIRTAEDLLQLYPYRYVDRTRFSRICDIDDEQTFVQIKGRFVQFSRVGEGRGARLVGMFSDGEQTIEVVWFKGTEYVTKNLQLNTDYVLFGKPSVFSGHYNFTHPDVEPLERFNQQKYLGLEPYYNTSEQMKSGSLNSKAVRKIMSGLIAQVRQGIPETLPSSLTEPLHLMSRTQAYCNIHFPADAHSLRKARERLKFEELFYLELQILRQAHQRNQGVEGYKMPHVGDFFNNFYFNQLPFPLTGAQKRVVREIYEDMKSGRQMNRLLQGDVGSGKTLVALLCALIAADNGFQTAIMAPTEILATQHLESLRSMTQGMNLHIDLLTGSTPKRHRDEIHRALTDGTLHILIGTHALIEDNVQFANLGLAIIDEQHRFGVAQRAKLWKKNRRSPHILVMTATPIPRTLAMTVYGDLHVSVIDELPPGRKPIQTYHRYISQRDAVDRFLLQQLRDGHQVYIVYPLILDNPKLELANVEQGYEYVRLHFPSYPASIVHGRQKSAEKDEQMRKFAEGKTRIMVATTVIEVGVNVPNASVMVIENAERFGLSTLHQLRGRVGRGAEQSYCILLTGVKLSRDTRKRMDIMVRSTDGFEIAEADMRMRGPGDMEGTLQSGLPFDLKIANLSTDGQLVELARRTAEAILELDSDLSALHNQIFVRQLQRIKQQIVNWGDIS
ncbi:MAG: ATP-dependent DNA helicase RecG [Paludibacteraceae bacterium]|nr:ATP-dependent DNA helicase RecG [Paludibacteraceae bacterium]